MNNAMIAQFFQNPMAMVRQRFNISQDIDINNPDAILNYLLTSGQVTQAQVNQAMAMRNNPVVQMYMRGGRR